MATAITPLANITLGSSAATVTFSSISGSYRDLMLVIGGGISSGASVFMRVNGDTGANYNYVFATGDGSSTYTLSSSSQTSGVIANWGIASNANIILHFFDYSATDKHKNVSVRANDASLGVDMGMNRWASTSAITSFSLYNTGIRTWNIGTSFALYGVSA